MKHTILVLEGGYPGMIESLEQHFKILRPQKPDPERIIQDHSEEIQGITTNLAPVGKNLIEAPPNLEIIAAGAVGYDHIDVAAAKARGVAVTNTPDVLTADTADTALLLALNVMRRAVEGDAFVRAGMWKQGPLPLATSMTGKTAGIVGLGRIGKAIATRLEAIGMKVIYHGPNEKKDVMYPYFQNLEEMAEACDLLVLACPGGEKTKDLIDYKVLKALGSQGYIVNIARGSVIHQQDLLVALANRAIAGAALDVYWKEPNVPEELFSMDNVVLTPHIGSATYETRERMGQIVVENLRAHFEGKPLLTPVEE